MKPQFNFCKLSTSCKIESEITVIALATEQVSHSYPCVIMFVTVVLLAMWSVHEGTGSYNGPPDSLE